MSGNRGEFNCLFCKGAYRASDCRVVTNVDQRKDILKKQGSCFICLRRGGHMVLNCDSKIQCFGCQGRHHLAVCDGGKSRVSGNSAMEAVCNLPEVSTPAMHVSSGVHVFLQTAQVVVSRPGMGSTHSLKVRAIFDTGAQRSYVSRGVVDSLKLETIKTENLRIATFGNQDQQLQAVNLIELALTKPETGFEMTLNAFSVPRICSDLQGQDLHWVKETYPRLWDIDFADTCSDGGPMQIDLLIGSDTSGISSMARQYGGRS